MPRAYTYMVRCADNSLYTGWTTDLEKRIAVHNAGKASRYTRSRLPVELVWWEEHETLQAARSREGKIKQLTRRQKLALLSEKANKNTPD